MVADGAIDREHPLLDLVLGIHDQGHRIAFGVAGHGLLGDQDGLFHRRPPSPPPGRTCPAADSRSDWGKSTRRMTDPVRRVHRDVAELQRALPGDRPFRPPVRSFTFFWLLPSLIEPAAGQTLLQTQQFGGGLGHVHVDGVQLLNGGQGLGLIGRYDRAFGDVGSTDTAGNGRRDARIGQIDAGCLHRGFPIGDIRFGLSKAAAASSYSCWLTALSARSS